MAGDLTRRLFFWVNSAGIRLESGLARIQNLSENTKGSDFMVHHKIGSPIHFRIDTQSSASGKYPAFLQGRRLVQICTKCYFQSPDSAAQCENCQADMSEYSVTAVALKHFQENSRVRYVRLVVSDTCCPACREQEGAYAKDEVPLLPVEGCSHPNGCRCFYQPFLEVIFP